VCSAHGECSVRSKSWVLEEVKDLALFTMKQDALKDQLIREEGGSAQLCDNSPEETSSNLFSSFDGFTGQWWLVHTKPRNEKALANDLNRLGVDHFLPLARVRRVYASRTVESRIPLFPSYLFINGGEDEYYRTLTTHRIVHVIDVADQERLNKDLRQVWRAITSEEPVDLYPGIVRGRRCRVVRGSLKGLEGVVLRRRSICRVYIEVKVLGQSAQLEIDPSLLEIIK